MKIQNSVLLFLLYVQLRKVWFYREYYKISEVLPLFYDYIERTWDIQGRSYVFSSGSIGENI